VADTEAKQGTTVLLGGPEILDDHHVRLEPKESQEDATHRRRKDFALFWFFLGALGLLFLVGLYYSFRGNSDQSKYGQVLVSAIVGGAISRMLAAKQ
jgi:hypothetical protein